MKLMKKILKSFILACNIWLWSIEMHPSDGATMNYTQIFFSWDQIPNANSYQINLQNTISQEEFQYNLTANSILIAENINWGSNYNWSICGIIDNNEAICSEIKNFTINPLADYFPTNINLTNYNENLSQDGITIMDFESLNCSGGLDKNGYPIWFADKDNFYERFVFTQFLNNGNLVGFGPGKGYEIDIDGNIIFETPSGYSIHHDFNKTIHDTYFMVTATVENQYCPEECNPSLPDSIPWQGDTFLEMDDNGNEIWSWNTFDYYDLNEYNPYYVETYTGSYEMDWTHSNSVSYDINSGSVFISVRNLSRISKINYDTKNLVWNLGNTDYMNEIYFEEDLNFSQQHSVQVLDNGNLLFFDNHRYLNPELSRCLEIDVNETDNSIEVIWEYILPQNLFTGSRGECDRLENGNTLITAGRTGNTIEVTPDNEIVWQIEVSNMGLDVTMYRSSRIPNLYPIAFSFEIDGLSENQDNLYVEPINNIITTKLHNSGWGNGWYTYTIYNMNNIEIISDSIWVNPFEEKLIDLNVEQLNSSFYSLEIYPIHAIEKMKSIEFELITSILLGDMNADNELNILDVVILANLILNDGDNTNGDLNQDESLNILDIVNLINIILNI